MTRYLENYTGPTQRTLSIAQLMSEHLQYSEQSLQRLSLDRQSIRQLPQRAGWAEKIEAFSSRFGRLQDHIGGKLIPVFATWLGEMSMSHLDMLNYAERMGWLVDAESFYSFRRLRNLLVHEYMADLDVVYDALCQALPAAVELREIVINMHDFMEKVLSE